MSNKEQHKEHQHGHEEPKAAPPPEAPEIAKVTLDVTKRLLTPAIFFLEVIEANPHEYSVITKTRTGELKQYRALAGGETTQIFDGEKEILEPTK